MDKPKRREHDDECNYWFWKERFSVKLELVNEKASCNCGAYQANQMHDQWVKWLEGIDWPEKKKETAEKMRHHVLHTYDGDKYECDTGPHKVEYPCNIAFNQAIDQCRKAVE